MHVLCRNGAFVKKVNLSHGVTSGLILKPQASLLFSFTAAGGQSFDQSWQRAQVPVSTGFSGGFLFIQGVRGNGQFGEIAVDDTTMTLGTCAVSTGLKTITFSQSDILVKPV